ncbi:thymidylate kinase [Russula earlei]|uniref:Thymidylate kinase n=1 Tax=Russula earlei TaxID=71964 RepID=A0ACC0U5H6_9AGAM|nr:thymidylate kinase [Russula earlei]
MARGAFIVVEGLDRSGKTTQTDLLASRLATSGVSVERRKFPDRTTDTGQLIDAYLRGTTDLDDRAIHLLFSANRWEATASLESRLSAGATVLCDRYAFSGVAFSAAKGLPLAWCRAPDVGLPAPDLTLFLDLAPEAAAERGRIWRGALASETRGWVTIDAGRDREAVAQDILEHVESHVHGIDAPIGRLWVDDDVSPLF